MAPSPRARPRRALTPRCLISTPTARPRTLPAAARAAQAKAIEPALPDADYEELANGGTGLPGHVVDTRFPPNLANAPVDMSRSVAYDDYASSPVHRFFQMWQQLDCSSKTASVDNPSGCKGDLFPWVEVTVGAGSNGAAQPANFTDQTTGEGSTSMQFYNVAKGRALLHPTRA